MIVISFALVKFHAFAILYVLKVIQRKLVVVVVVFNLSGSLLLPSKSRSSGCRGTLGSSRKSETIAIREVDKKQTTRSTEKVSKSRQE